MLKFFIAAVALLAVAGGLAFWAYSLTDDSAEAQVQVVRWGNVTVVVPEGSGLVAVQRYWQDDRPVLIVGPSRDISLGIVIDATTGDVLLDSTPPELRAVLDQVRQTISVSALDRSAAPWPYNGVPPNTIPEEWGIRSWGKITFIPPDPASGIRVVLQEGGGTDGRAYLAIQFTNGGSTLSINADSSTVYPDTTTILPEDQQAFDRLLASVRLVKR